ncbi:MAG: Dabb family protein [Halioglobus sp.]|nr:Dabb family protein [Halioglobus sp.]
MIEVQDRIEIAGDNLDGLLQLFHRDYIAQAAQRGLRFVEHRISPPVKLQSAPVTLWLRWQVEDTQAWWAMRAQSGDPGVARFWAQVDTLCVAREREYLCDSVPGELPGAEDVSRFQVTTHSYRETAQLSIKEDVDAEQRTVLEAILRDAAAELPGVERVELAANYAPEYAVGHYTWDILYPDRDTAEAAQRSAYWTNSVAAALERYCSACHALRLDTVNAGVRRKDLANGVKRTAFFRLLPGTGADTAQRFEQDLLEMARQIPDILNWRLSRAQVLPWDTADCAPWTYVWEQEFESLDGLLGPYMAHPHHWAHVDRWFDPESGKQAVDVNLSHAFSALEKSIIGAESN